MLNLLQEQSGFRFTKDRNHEKFYKHAKRRDVIFLKLMKVSTFRFSQLEGQIPCEPSRRIIKLKKLQTLIFYFFFPFMHCIISDFIILIPLYFVNLHGIYRVADADYHNSGYRLDRCRNCCKFPHRLPPTFNLSSCLTNHPNLPLV